MDFKTVAECNLALLKDERHCDVVFIVGEAKMRIPSHQFPLMVRSPVFEAMFAERWNKTAKEISIPDVEPSVFRQFLQYMYGDKFTTKINEAIKILYVASKYQVTSLIEQCEMLMKTAIQLEDAIQIYQTARMFSLASLEKQALDLMAKQFSKLIDHRSFGLMDEDTLLNLLPRDDLQVDELKLFDALLRWTCVKLGTKTPAPANQRKLLGKILHLVRFPQMRTQDFAMKVIPTNILSSDESVAIFTYMTSEPGARSALRDKLRFPWQSRQPMGIECIVDFYEENRTCRNTLYSSYFAQVSTHTDASQFSFSWKQLSKLKRTASIASVVLRGPDYSSVSNNQGLQGSSWISTRTWTVSLKLGKITDPCSGTTIFDGESKTDKIQIFGNKDTNVVVDPPFPLQPGCDYLITVSYSGIVYLPNPGSLGSTSTQDFITSTRLKANGFSPVNKEGISELTFDVNNHCSSSGRRNGYFDCGYDNGFKSHCIRSVKLRVCEF